jgi:hypothetical protein
MNLEVAPSLRYCNVKVKTVTDDTLSEEAVFNSSEDLKENS